MADTAALSTGDGSTTDTTTGLTTDTTGTTTTDTTDTGATGSAATGARDDDGKDWKAQAEKWRALARKHEAAAKENADARTKLHEIEESQKTEQQRLTDRLNEAEKELAEHRVLAMRAQAALEAGLDSDMAQFLTATEPDAALQQARALAKKVQPGRPDLRQGTRTTATPAADMNAWLRRAAGYNSTP